jgi:hypothetical protein
VKVDGTWMLAGALFAIDGFAGQPAGTALFGNDTFAADLSFYRSQIISLVTPSCGLGIELVPAMSLLLWFNRRRHRARSSPRGAESCLGEHKQARLTRSCSLQSPTASGGTALSFAVLKAQKKIAPLRAACASASDPRVPLLRSDS